MIGAGYVLPPLAALPSSEEQIEQRLSRMWSAGRSIALISACTGLEPQEIRDRCRGIPRPSIRVLSAGCNQRSEASREAIRLSGSSLNFASVANGAGVFSISTAGAVRP